MSVPCHDPTPASVAPASRHNPAPTVAVALLVAAAVGLVHWPVLNAGAICFDDADYLFDNPVLMSPSIASAKQVFSEVLESQRIEGYYEPLTLVSLMLDVAAGGTRDNLRPFHRTSLALHAANAALLVFLLYLLFRQLWAAALAALLFGVHPLTVEPVAWVWERKTVLAAFFAILCLMAYVRYTSGFRGQGPRTRRRLFYGGSLAAFVLALLAKPTVTPLPALLLLLDFWPLRRLSRAAVVEKTPFFLVALVSAFITIHSTSRNAVLTLPGEYPISHAPLRVGYLVMFYLGKVLWPVNLTSIYLLPEPMSLWNPWVFAGVFGTLALVAGLLASLRFTRAAFAGGLFFLLAISPTLGIVGYSWVVASDKYAYLPLIGLLLPLTALLARAWEASARPATRPIACAAAGLLALAAAHATRSQIARWSTTEGYFRYMSDLAPRAPAVHASLGLELVRKGDLDAGIESLARAIEIEPTFYAAQQGMGYALLLRNEATRAIPYLEQAAALIPRSFSAQYNLGLALCRAGRLDEGIARFREALSIRPDPTTQSNIAAALIEKGEIDAALTVLADLLRREPNHAMAHYNMGHALRRKGRFDEAVQHLQRAIELNPANRWFREELDRALRRN